MAQLPLKIRVGLRDHWEKANSPVRESISALSEVIGLPVDVTLEAHMLWRALERCFPDQGIFVPSVVDVVKSWMECITSRLENEDANAAWAEQLLDRCGSRLKAQVETQSGSLARTKWVSVGSAFIISIPETSPPYSSVSSSFMTDFENVFKDNPQNEPSAKRLPVQSRCIDDEGWADVEMPSSRRGPAKQSLPSTPPSLPQLNTIARPDIFFLHQTPYYMTVKMNPKRILIQGSHQPSLELLANYFSKWTRTMRNDLRKIPVLKVELQESHFGLGILFDTVTIEPADSRQTWVDPNPILLIAFIEGVLGYQQIYERGNRDDWYFKRDEKFM